MYHPMLSSLLLPFLIGSAHSSPLPQNSSCSLNSYTVVEDNGSGIWPYRTYKSGNITSPTFNITANGGELAPGLIFIGVGNAFSVPGENRSGPYIMTSDGDLVWSGPNTSISNFRAQTVNGKSAMSYWIGSGSAAAGGADSHGYGEVQVFDTSYEQTYTICPKLDITLPPGTESSCVADVHESYITENNTMLMTVYNITTADLTSVGGPADGWVIDPLAVEVDLTTSEALWVWSPLAHVAINTTHSPLMGQGVNSSTAFDWFHTNSIQSHDGHYLINARGTWGTYYVSQDGSVEWTINGADGGDFGSLPEGGQFSWQHHARLHETSNPNQKILTNFADNNGDLSTNNDSLGLGLLLSLPPSKDTPPTLWSRLDDSADPVVAFAEGSYQITDNTVSGLDSSNGFLGYGARPVIKEFGPNPKIGGDLRWSASFGYVNNNNTAQSYRAFKQDWHATPTAPVDLVVTKAGDQDGLSSCGGTSDWRGYVSWNGATDVTDYAVYTGSDAGSMQSVGTFKRMGFETEFVVPSGAKMVQVRALESGRECGQSAAVSVA